MNLAALLATTAGDLPDKAALVEGPKSSGSQVTFAQLHSEASRVAAGLEAAGLRPGDRVALAMHNIPHFAFSYFGILQAGGVVVPLNSMLAEPEVARVMTDSDARFAIGGGPSGEVAAAAARSVPSVERTFSVERWAELGDVTEHDVVERRDDDLAVLAYTSGTTGDPKGAMLSHGNLAANLRQQTAIPNAHVREQDVLFLALPLFHIFGLNVCLGLLVMHGATGVLVDRFEPVPTLRLIQDRRVTVLFGAPTMYGAWLSVPGADQYDLSSVRLAISGAAPLPPDILRDFRDIFGIAVYEGYGLTETSPTVASNRMVDRPRPGSVGKAIPEVEFRICNESGDEVELGDTGEVVVRGPNVFKGYWRKPDETERAFHDGGWFRTGDIGVMDEEGFLYLVDRKRDLIIVSGFNVFPSEVEHALLENPKIEEAAVIGVPHPYTGEAVKAYVVLKGGERASEAELLDDIGSRIARFKAPQAIEIVERLPHLPTGKVLRRALRT